jgi:hypothetical protein
VSAIEDGIKALAATAVQFSTGVTNFGGAVQALQAAATQAVMNVGPAIDALSGANPGVMNMTHWAWSKNSVLSNFNAGPSATQADVDASVAAVKQIVDWYTQAHKLAKSLSYKPPVAAAPAPSPVYAPPAAAPPPVAAPPPTTAPATLAGWASFTPEVTPKRVAITGAGAGVGFLAGSIVGRLTGLAVGGPIGGTLVGAVVGWLFGK